MKTTKFILFASLITVCWSKDLSTRNQNNYKPKITTLRPNQNVEPFQVNHKKHPTKLQTTAKSFKTGDIQQPIVKPSLLTPSKIPSAQSMQISKQFKVPLPIVKEIGESATKKDTPKSSRNMGASNNLKISTSTPKPKTRKPKLSKAQNTGPLKVITKNSKQQMLTPMKKLIDPSELSSEEHHMHVLRHGVFKGNIPIILESGSGSESASLEIATVKPVATKRTTIPPKKTCSKQNGFCSRHSDCCHGYCSWRNSKCE